MTGNPHYVPADTRERACRVLGHDAPALDGLDSCPVPFAQVVEQLLDRYEALRARVGDEPADTEAPLDDLGEVLTAAASDDPGVAVAFRILDDLYPTDPDARILARFVVEQLGNRRWIVVRADR